MLFNSYLFVFAFLPLCLAGCYALWQFGLHRAAKAFLLAMSLWFYGYFSLSYLFLMLGSIGVNFCFHRFVARRRSKGVLACSVACNLGLLFYFKYFDFFLSTVNATFGSDFPLRGILLPLGISFFTFQQIGFLADTYRGEVERTPFLDYALFVAFFPQLIAGPIVSAGEMLPQFARMGRGKADWERLAAGLVLFVLGLSKKALLADALGAGVDFGYGNLDALGCFDAALVIFLYALQLYFDFSGYCDMARGLGWMLGIEIPANFDSPYQATNIVDFWKRWHITLNRFFTKYVYIPLGGSRRGEGRMYANLLAVFFLSGLWHGAGIHFILWGMLHGLLYAATRFWQRHVRGADAKYDRSVTKINAKNDKEVIKISAKYDESIISENADNGNRILKISAKNDINVTKSSVPNERKTAEGAWRLGRRILTFMSQMLLFCYVSLAWVYFRAADIGQANRLLMTALFGERRRISTELAKCLQLDEIWYVLKALRLDNFSYSRYLPMAILFSAGLYLALFGKNAARRVEGLRCGMASAAVTAALLLWCVLSFSGVSTFLYFNF